MIVRAYCDGSGTYNPGAKAAIGVVVFEGDCPVASISEHVGDGTSQYAELRAVRRALHLGELVLAGASGLVEVISDSQYALGVCDGGMNARAHRQLVSAIRAQVAFLRERAEVRFSWVRGHAGTFGNEVADWLAGRARARAIGEPWKRGAPRGWLGETKIVLPEDAAS